MDAIIFINDVDGEQITHMFQILKVLCLLLLLPFYIRVNQCKTAQNTSYMSCWPWCLNLLSVNINVPHLLLIAIQNSIVHYSGYWQLHPKHKIEPQKNKRKSITWIWKPTNYHNFRGYSVETNLNGNSVNKVIFR